MARAKKTDAYDAQPRDLGRYRLHGEIASGGMATVHFGRQVGSGGFSKTVAIKRLHPQFGKMPEFVTMFLAEARLAARIRHPNVVQPLDVLTVDEELFLVMEYVEGDSLSRLMRATLARKERVPLPIAVSILCGVLHGLHAAHEAKSDKGDPLELVHRDVSPQNVLVGIDGVARVIDFGIAKAADNVQFTRDGELKGKLSYMAPEQLNGHRCTRRSDIYAAAVILWEVLTSQRLFDADYQSAILNNILYRPVDPPSDVVPDVPRSLDAIVLKGLARDPSDRFQTARDMAIALEDSVAMATQSSVGSWVEVIAKNSLAQRSARVSEIESVPSMGPSAEPHPLSRPQPPGVAGTWPTLVSGGPQDAPPSRSSPQAQRRSSIPPPMPARRTHPGMAPTPQGSPETRRGVPPPPPYVDPQAPIDLDRASTLVIHGSGAPPSPFAPTVMAPYPTASEAPAPPSRRPTPPPPAPPAPAPQTPRSPERPMAMPAALPPPPSVGLPSPVNSRRPPPGPTMRIALEPKRSSGGGMLAFLFLVVVAVVGFFLVAPEFVRRGYISGAERAYGITLSIDKVVLTTTQIRLLGVSATAREIPGGSARCREIDLTLNKLTPSELNAIDLVVNLDGAYPALADAASRWNSAHVKSADPDSAMQRVRVESGQVIWTRPLGEQTRLEAENLTAMAERVVGRPLGDDLQLAAPIVDLVDGSGKMGPWPLKVTMTNRVAHAVLSFDSSGSSSAQAVVVVTQGSLTSVELNIPRTPFAQMGIPPAVVGLRADQPFFLQGDAEYFARTTSRAEAQVRLVATGAHLNGATTPSEVSVELHLDGDPRGPIEWGDGLIAAGSARARPTGTVTFGDGFFRAELLWKGGGGRCASGGEYSLSAAVRFDSRNLDGSSWATSGLRCARP